MVAENQEWVHKNTYLETLVAIDMLLERGLVTSYRFLDDEWVATTVKAWHTKTLRAWVQTYRRGAAESLYADMLGKAYFDRYFVPGLADALDPVRLPCDCQACLDNFWSKVLDDLFNTVFIDRLPCALSKQPVAFMGGIRFLDSYREDLMAKMYLQTASPIHIDQPLSTKDKMNDALSFVPLTEEP